MSLKKFLPLILSILPGLLFAQTMQRCIVKEYNGSSAKTPLPGVQVVVKNAGSAVSSKNGQLTLKFKQKKAGSKVEVEDIEKSGYEIFNKSALQQWYISDTRQFAIIMCQSSKFRELCDRYSASANEYYAKQRAKKELELEKLREEGVLTDQSWRQKLQDLQALYEKQSEKLESYVDRFARIDLSELDEQERTIVSLAEEGKFDEAIELYEQQHYEDKFQQECADIKTLSIERERLAEVEEEKNTERDSLFACIQRQVQLYTLAGGQENIQKAADLYLSVAYADTTYIKGLEEIENYFSDQLDFENGKKIVSLLISNYALGTYEYVGAKCSLFAIDWILALKNNPNKYYDPNVDIENEILETEAFIAQLDNFKGENEQKCIDLKISLLRHIAEIYENKYRGFTIDTIGDTYYHVTKDAAYYAEMASLKDSVEFYKKRILSEIPLIADEDKQEEQRHEYFMLDGNISPEEFDSIFFAPMEQKFERNQDKFRVKYAKYAEELAGLYTDAGNLQEAIHYYRLSSEQYDILEKLNPQRFAWDQLKMKVIFGECLEDYGAKDEALAVYMSAEESSLQRLEKDPGNSLMSELWDSASRGIISIKEESKTEEDAVSLLDYISACFNKRDAFLKKGYNIHFAPYCYLIDQTAGLLSDLQDYNTAAKLYLTLLDLYKIGTKRNLEVKRSDINFAYICLAFCYNMQGESTEAYSTLEKAETELPEYFSTLLDYEAKVAENYNDTQRLEVVNKKRQTIKVAE